MLNIIGEGTVCFQELGSAVTAGVERLMKNLDY